jgi:ribose/xylose/arabinose/galactoside ABC-type transport system permease subunit
MLSRPPVPRRELAGAALALATLAGVALLAPGLLTALRLREAVGIAAPVLIAAVGATLLLSLSQIDLSLGPLMAVGSVLAAGLSARGVPLPLVALLVVLLGATAGAANGELVARAGLPCVLVTAATGVAAEQGWRWLMSGPPAPVLPPRLQWLGLSPSAGVTLLVALSLVVVAGGAITFQREGQADGRHTMISRFALAGALATLAGFLDLVRSPHPVPPGGAFEVRILAAALIGGTTTGGTMVGTFSGALVMGALAAALPLVPRLAPWAPAIDAAVLLAAVIAQVLSRRLPSLPPAGAAGESEPPSPTWLVWLLLLLAVVMSVLGLMGPSFMSLANLAEVGRIASELCLVALPLGALLAEDSIDLGVAGTVALGMAALGVSLKLGSMSVLGGIALVLMVGLVVGMVPAALAAGPGLVVTLVTLATGALWSGMAGALLSHARKPVTPLPPPLLGLGRGLLFEMLPFPALAALAMAALFQFLPRRRDRPLLRLGGLLLACAAGCALCAIAQAGRRGAVRLDEPAFLVCALATAVIGGAQPGVPGTVPGTLLAGIVVAALVNGVPDALPGAPAAVVAAALLVAAMVMRRRVPAANTTRLDWRNRGNWPLTAETTPPPSARQGRADE